MILIYIIVIGFISCLLQEGTFKLFFSLAVQSIFVSGFTPLNIRMQQQHVALRTVKAATCTFLKFIFTEHTIKAAFSKMERRPTDAFLSRPEILTYDISRLVMEIWWETALYLMAL